MSRTVSAPFAVADLRSAREAHFSRIDRLLFQRLYAGPLDPLIFTLDDGATVSGELKSIKRISQEQPSGVLGKIVLVTANGEIELDYKNIQNIS